MLLPDHTGHSAAPGADAWQKNRVHGFEWTWAVKIRMSGTEQARASVM